MLDHGIILQNWLTRLRRMPRRILRQTLFALLCAGVALSTFWVWQSRAARAAGVTTFELTTLPQSKAAAEDGGKVIAGYEGTFDPRTRRMTIQAGRVERSADGRLVNVRVDPNGTVPPNTGFAFTVVNSTFLQTGDLAGNISGEIQLMNKTSVTLYNTRLIFTKFKVCPASGACNGNTATQDATATPGQTGFSYYNDGFIPYQGKLHLSRAYGNIAPGGTSNAVWSFNVSTAPASFFFSYVVLADIGVATESVYPAAVQVNANNGATVVIRGQNFSGSPTVTLLDANGNPGAALTNVAVNSDTQITATVPANTAPGLYGVRVTLAGGTPGGTNSSDLFQRLTVTGVPSQTLSGNVGSLSGAGPFLISSDVTFTAGVTAQPGTIFYVSTGARVILAAGGNLTANGGIPGVSIPSATTPSQIVFTAQRSPGAALPNQGAWGGIDATAASSATMSLRNVVVEYGGANNKPNLDITGSGRTLRFTDSITRHSAGAGLVAGGSNDILTGFTRNRIEYNGAAAGTAAVQVSANAALGLFEIPATTGQDAAPLGTFVTDAQYFYGAANVFFGNQLNAVQILATANDFTRSGVLVSQGDTPIQIRGSNANPSIIGAVPPAAPAELTITPGALIQLDAGMDFQAGDYPSKAVGGLAANGFAGVNQVPGAGQGAARYITFDRIGASNFGALFFARNATSSSMLFFVRVLNGGASGQGNGAVISDGVNLPVRNSQINNSSSGGLVELTGSVLGLGGTTGSGNASLLIDTVAGGLYGDGNTATKTTVVSPLVVALDPQGRGVYFVDQVTNRTPLLRFMNTTRTPVTLAGIRIVGGTIRSIAGGGSDLLDGVSALNADLGKVTGLAVSPGTGDVVYFIDQGGLVVRCVNVSTSPVTINGQSVGAGRVSTFSADSQFGPSLNGLTVRPNGDVFVADATTGQHRIYRIPSTGGNATPFAGNGAVTKAADAFSAGLATNIPLLTPRAVTVEANGNILIADTGHGRVIRVDAGGQATLVAQFTADLKNPIGNVYVHPPTPSGLAVLNGNVYIALGSAHQLVVVQGQTTPKIIGDVEKSCDYSMSSCGDGGPAAAAQLNLLTSSADIPLASIVADPSGIFICDQVLQMRGRLRYVNLSNASVEVAGLTIPANVINTVAGTGNAPPYDGGLATSAEFKSPGGVAVDPANGNLWIADTLNSKLRYINRTNTTITLFGSLDAANRVIIPPGTEATVNRDVGLLVGGATDDVPAVQAGFDTPSGVLVTAQGVFVVDTKRGQSLPGTTQNPINRRTSVVRFINTSSQPVTFFAGQSTETTIPAGQIKIVFGGGVDTDKTSVGDGLDVHLAKLVGATDIAISPITGDFYIADVGNSRIRRIRKTTGEISTVKELPGANLLALTTPTAQYTGIAFDSTGRLLVLDSQNNKLLRRNNPDANSDTASTVNNFTTLLTGPPLSAPRALAFDRNDQTKLYVTNAGDHKVLRLSISGNTATGVAIAGTTQGYSGDYGPALQAQMNLAASQILVSTFPPNAKIEQFIGIAVGLNNEIYFCDPKNDSVRRLR